MIQIIILPVLVNSEIFLTFEKLVSFSLRDNNLSYHNHWPGGVPQKTVVVTKLNKTEKFI
jgi:hypothetical protein